MARHACTCAAQPWLHDRAAYVGSPKCRRQRPNLFFTVSTALRWAVVHHGLAAAAATPNPKFNGGAVPDALISETAVKAAAGQQQLDGAIDNGDGNSGGGGALTHDGTIAVTQPPPSPSQLATRALGNDAAVASGIGAIIDHAGPPPSKSRLQNAIDIARFALPLAAQNVCGYSLNALSGSLVGRLGPGPLSAATLGNSAYSMTGLSLVWGGAAGLETLCGQAHGAGDGRLMRRVLLRAVLVSWAVCVPVVALWGRAEVLLGALGQSPALVGIAAAYLQSLAPSLFFYSLSECLQVYMVVQGLTGPTAAAKAVVTALGPLYYWGCMFWLDLGLLGAGHAYALCKATNAALLLGWMARRAARGRQQPTVHPAAAADTADGGSGSDGNHTSRSISVTCSSRSRSGSSGAADAAAVAPGPAEAKGGGSGGEAAAAARLNPHAEVLTSPLAEAAAAGEFSAAAAATSTAAAAVNMRVVPAAVAAAARSAATVAASAAASTTANAVAAATAATGGFYDRLRRLVAAVRVEVSEALDPRACREYVRFGVPAAVMCCLEWWAYEALVIMAGWLPNADVAVGCMGICLTVGGWMYMVPQAVATATCARVAGALGAGDAEGAQRTYQAALVLVLLLQSVLAAALLPNARAVAAAFCPDPAAATLTAALLPITALSTLGDGLNCVLNNGVLRACGRQALGARLHLLSYWLCGLPAAYAAAFPGGLGLAGFVGAIGATSLAQGLVLGALISRWDWHAEVRNSRALLDSMANNTGSSSSSSSQESSSPPSDSDTGFAPPTVHSSPESVNGNGNGKDVAIAG